VFGICGPVSEDGSVDVMLSLMHWGRIEEKVIEKETGIAKIKLINDFVANGYGISDITEDDLVTIYKPTSPTFVENKMKLLIGIGTSLGVCYIARETEQDKFEVYPSEASTVRMPLYNQADRDFEKFLREDKKVERRDVAVFLGGSGLHYLLEFYLTKKN
jgi:glucokinase